MYVLCGGAENIVYFSLEEGGYVINYKISGWMEHNVIWKVL